MTPLDGSPVKSLPNSRKNSDLNSQDSINGSERTKLVLKLSYDGQQESEQFGNDSAPQGSNLSAIDTPARKSPRRPGSKKTPPKSKKKDSSSVVESDEEKENNESKSTSNKTKSPRAVSAKSTPSKFVLLPTSLSDEALVRPCKSIKVNMVVTSLDRWNLRRCQNNWVARWWNISMRKWRTLSPTLWRCLQRA